MSNLNEIWQEIKLGWAEFVEDHEPFISWQMIIIAPIIFMLAIPLLIILAIVLLTFFVFSLFFVW